MMLNHISSLPKRLHRIVTSFWRRDIYYVTDTANWSFYWDAYYITLGLRECLGLPAHVITDPQGLRKQIIHFGDRAPYLNGQFRRLHSSNDVFLTWFHGEPADPAPNMQCYFAALPEAAGWLASKLTKSDVRG